MTFNQLKEYHLKQISVVLKSGKEVRGIITSHKWNTEGDKIIAISVLTESYIERIECTTIQEIKILDSEG